MPNKWLFSHQEISRSPSITCGRIESVGAEAVLRAKAARFVFDCGAELLLPQYTISSACIYLHRFYMRRSLMEHHSYNIAATCLYLSCKVHESLRKTEDFIIRIARVARKDPDLRLAKGSKEYQRWHEILLSSENAVLEHLCFELEIELAYSFLDEHIRFAMNILPTFTSEDALKKAIWPWLNDSYKSMACLMYSQCVVSIACVFLGIYHLHPSLTVTMNNEVMEKFALLYRTIPRDIQRCCCCIVQLLDMVEVRHTVEGMFENNKNLS
eukprot:Partr_v1_DN28048_c3_g1_i2_m56703 putative Cyclin K